MGRCGRERGGVGLLGLLSSLDYGMGGRLGKVIYLDSQNTVICIYDVMYETMHMR